MRETISLHEKFIRRRDIQPEFVLLRTGRDVMMRIRTYVRVQTYRHFLGGPQTTGRAVDRLQLLHGLDVEHQDAETDRFLDLRNSLADGGEHGLFGVHSDFFGTEKFSAGHDVETRALIHE